MRHYLLIAIILYALSFWGTPAFDPDLGWHLLGGQWIWEHQQVPQHDFINAFNATWVDYHWLGQILLYKIYALTGFDGLRLGLGLLMAYLAKVLVDIAYLSCPGLARPFHRDIRTQELSSFTLALAFLWGFLPVAQVASVRPQMFAIVGVALALRSLLKQHTSGTLPLLFLLNVILTNVHVYWVFIPVLWFIWRCLPRFARKRAPSCFYAWGGLALLFSAGFISPYGILGAGAELPFGVFTNLALLFDYALTTSEMKELVAEFRGSFAAEGIAPLLLVLYIALVARFASPRRIGVYLPQLIAALLGVFLAYRTLKFLPIFAIFGLPLLAQLVTPRSLRASLPRLHFYLQRFGVRVAKGASLAALLASLFLAVRYDPGTFDVSSYMRELPIEACGAIPRLVPASAGLTSERVLTHFDYGGWCKWAMYQAAPQRDLRVTTDGRTQFIAPQEFARSFDLFRLHFAWARTLTEWNPGVALVEKHRALAQYLLRAKRDWQLIYEDQKFAVFLRQAPHVD